nr:retrovirus-related Pol polyprotein from transposon TNT 1-94 [Tanacetum cinerariifolium]
MTSAVISSSMATTTTPMEKSVVKHDHNLDVESQETQQVTEVVFDYAKRAQWLRASLLGANDGLLSTASLMMGVGALREDKNSMILSGVAGLVAGACSMGIGEFVSVYSQYDIELSQIKREIKNGIWSTNEDLEDKKKGLPSPGKAASASAIAFAVGASVPLLAAGFISVYHVRIAVVLVAVTMALIGFGGLSAVLGRAPLMKALLGAQDTWESVTTEYEEPIDAEIGAMNANQLKALKEKRMKAKTTFYLLFESVDESGFEKIVGASTAKQAWDTLEKGYKCVDRVKQVRIQTLHGELEAMRMKETEGVSDYITQNFENVVCTIEESKDLEDLKIEELAGSLEAHEQRKNKKKQESLDEALKTKATIKDEKESEQRGKHFNQNSRGRGRRRGRGGQGYRPSVDCYNCGKHGHYARDYRSAKRTEEKTNLVTEVEESGVLLMAREESISKIDTMWYLDSGASNHMSGQKDLFVEMTEVVQGHVLFGDASKIDVKGRGKIRLFQNGKERMIEDVSQRPLKLSKSLRLWLKRQQENALKLCDQIEVDSMCPYQLQSFVKKKELKEVVQCAVYIQNRCPHIKLVDKTPQEIWSGVKPTVSYFRVFGSVAYAHVPDQTRKKLDDKSKMYIFIGYDERTKAFRLYDPIEKKVTVSRDVFVNEECTWDWRRVPAYAKEILKRSKMEDCNPVVTPMELGTKLSKFEGGKPVDADNYRSLVGSLRYLTSTRPDLSYSVGVISRFMENPKYAHWKALKRILRYVKGTESLGLFYSSFKEYTLTGYSDSDWHGDVDDRKSTSGYVFF